MPRISAFFGIIIRMYYDERNHPHLHAEFQGNRAVLDFLGSVIKGDLPRGRLFAWFGTGLTCMWRSSMRTGNSLGLAETPKEIEPLKRGQTIWDMNEVERIEYRHDYVCNVVFDGGLSAKIDFEPYLALGPIFEPLKDIEYFNTASIEGGTISWPNGADVSPERLYEKVESANKRFQADWPSASLQANR